MSKYINIISISRNLSILMTCAKPLRLTIGKFKRLIINFLKLTAQIHK